MKAEKVERVERDRRQSEGVEAQREKERIRSEREKKGDLGLGFAGHCLPAFMQQHMQSTKYIMERCFCQYHVPFISSRKINLSLLSF